MIPALGLETMTRVRQGAPTNVGGLPEFSAPTSTTIRMSPQPASANTMRRLPDGMRADQVLELYGYAELRAASDAPDEGWPADQVVFGGRTWQVERVERYRQPVGLAVQYEAVLVLVDPIPAMAAP